MWGKKANRIAELEARLVVALRDREPAVDTAHDTALRSELATARATLRAKDARLDLLQQQVDQLIARLGEYADQAAGAEEGERRAHRQRQEMAAERYVWQERGDRYRAAWRSARRRARGEQVGAQPVHDELWSLLDWCFWGAGMGDVLREPLADAMTAAITEQQRADALRVMAAWTASGRKPVGRWRYEDEKRRIGRLRRACARYRAELADQKRVIDQQGIELLNAFDYSPGDRARLGLPVQEVSPL